jgi:two-component system, OmpR family, response regulator
MKAASLQPSTVLLVDDSRDGLLIRRALLEEQGFTVQVARNGEEGLKLFEGCRFDVVVTDFHMPKMTGIEMIGRIRALSPQARIVLLSRAVETQGLTEENTGADAVIAKNSAEAAHLVRTVNRLAHRAPARKKPAASQLRSRALARTRA